MKDSSTTNRQAADVEMAGNSLNEERSIPVTGNSVTSTKKRAPKTPQGSSTASSTRKKDGSVSRKKKKKRSVPVSNLAMMIKYTALVLLVAQMVGLVLLMRYSRTTRDPDRPLYLASTAVFFMEAMKLVICLLVLALQTRSQFLTQFWKHTVESPSEMAKLCVPSLLYTIQNNLLYLALTNLDAATYQVCYQLKTLTTAIFSVIILQRRFSATKWIALVVLTVGVAIVQLSGSGDQHNHPDNEHVHHANNNNINEAEVPTNNRTVGLIAVLCATCTSGFSGVYFEKILKGSRTSLWIRNIQMGLPSVVMAYLTVYLKDGQAVQKIGFTGGYSNLVWVVITIQAVGGLIVATVVKYADSVLKVFATSFSIVVSCIFSAFLFDFHPTNSFLVGASLVVTATVMYSSPEKKPRRKPVLPTIRSTSRV